MRERILGLTSPEIASCLWMGTFHSIFARILRYNAERIGFRNDYTIYDANDSKTLIKQIIKDMQLELVYCSHNAAAIFSVDVAIVHILQSIMWIICEKHLATRCWLVELAKSLWSAAIPHLIIWIVLFKNVHLRSQFLSSRSAGSYFL